MPSQPDDFPLREDARARWFRAVPSQYPPRLLWEDYASAEEFEAAALIEGLTSERLRAEHTALASIPVTERMFGRGASPVMAAFCYPNPDGSRFSAGHFGVYYAAESIDTAATEVSYHRRRFWLDNPALPRVQMFRVYVGRTTQALLDLRPETDGGPLHDPDSWRASQAFGEEAFRQAQWGLRYRSVRRLGGECIALLRPLASTPVTQSAHLELRFDGQQVIWRKGATS